MPSIFVSCDPVVEDGEVLPIHLISNACPARRFRRLHRACRRNGKYFAWLAFAGE